MWRIVFQRNDGCLGTLKLSKERERERGVNFVLPACKDEHTMVDNRTLEHTLFTGQREREREREKGGGREREYFYKE
jgi:hypothetical protein